MLGMHATMILSIATAAAAAGPDADPAVPPHARTKRRGARRAQTHLELPRFPMGVNSTPHAYLSVCPSRSYRQCFGRAIEKRYAVHNLFTGSLANHAPAAVRAPEVIGCSSQPPYSAGRPPSPSAGVSLAHAALLPSPPPPPGPPDPLADAPALDSASAAIALGATGGRLDAGRLLKQLRDAESLRTAAEAPEAGPLRCSADSALINERALALLGVPSAPGPAGLLRRALARASWLKSPEVGFNVTVCFVLSAYVPPDEAAALVAEAAEHGDMLFLPVAESHMILRAKTKYSNYTKMGRGMPTFKQFAFFDFAATAVPGVPFVGKVDDDTAVNLRELLPVLEQARCFRYTFTAAINWGALIPHASFAGTRGERCGFGWFAQNALDNFGRSWGTPGAPGWVRACDEFGAVPPFPYGTGAGYIFSGPLLRWVAKNRQVRQWVAEARGASRDEFQWQKYEDTTTGYWLTYADGPVHYINIGRWVHDFRCHPDGARMAQTGALYRPPSPETLMVHNLKRRGFHAAFQMMQQGARYNHRRCVRDAELPRLHAGREP